LLMVPVRSIGRSWEIADDAALCAGRAPRPVLDNDLESTAGCRFAQVGLADAGSQWFRRRELRRGDGASFMGNSGALRITGTENLYDNFRHLVSPIARQPEMRSPLTLGGAEFRRAGCRDLGLRFVLSGWMRLGWLPAPRGGWGRERLASLVRARLARARLARAAGMVGRAYRGDPRKGVMTRPAVPG
jgi:hypothetical protein